MRDARQRLSLGPSARGTGTALQTRPRPLPGAPNTHPGRCPGRWKSSERPSRKAQQRERQRKSSIQPAATASASATRPACFSFAGGHHLHLVLEQLLALHMLLIVSHSPASEGPASARSTHPRESRDAPARAVAPVLFLLILTPSPIWRLHLLPVRALLTHAAGPDSLVPSAGVSSSCWP
ncbi:hypothetical protein MDA_GLEAN10002181 [Myotis davidii]|uniref:Uncharacterized protein n=1 Tax=Myotis davidii TaxID=225400 RepID=L5M8D2_MYODS|nr:hypothetical protein MDA_GLEAN10002181 [Myotis davidii]